MMAVEPLTDCWWTATASWGRGVLEGGQEQWRVHAKPAQAWQAVLPLLLPRAPVVEGGQTVCE